MKQVRYLPKSAANNWLKGGLKANDGYLEFFLTGFVYCKLRSFDFQKTV